MSSEKTEKPSSHRLSKARGEGQIPRSRDLTAAITMLMGGYILFKWLPDFGRDLRGIMGFNFTLSIEEVFDPEQMIIHLGASMFKMLEMLLPFALVLLLTTAIASALLGGWLLTFNTLQPKLSKVSPLAGIKRLFSLQPVVEFVKSIFKVLLMGYIAFFYIRREIDNILLLFDYNLAAGLVKGADILSTGFLYICLGVMLIGLIDAPYQKWKHTRDLRMSKQELKDEHKNRQGNPEIKGRIRQVQQEAAFRRMRKTVPSADVVIVNPTHFSVAIKYDPAKADAPYVVAKGEDFMALRLRLLAQEFGVEIVESPALTRSIYYTTRVNQKIPAGLYVAMAQVLHHVMRLKSYRLGKGEHPGNLPMFAIPPGLNH